MEPNKFMLLAAKHVKGVRNALALTQAEMATRVNKAAPKNIKVTRMDLSKYERAQVKMPVDKYLKIMSLNPPT